MPKILFIDDNPEILEANIAHFKANGFSVLSAETGIKALAQLNEEQFDCIVLDVLLPDLDGFAICKAARTITQTPIIFLSCLDDLDEKVKGLMAGGDDYLTKPYSLKELFARVQAQIRRKQITPETPAADFYIDSANRMIHTAEKNIFFSQKEYDLFILFYENAATTFTKAQIMERIWKDKTDTGAVAVYVSKLRRKIAFAEKYIGCIQSSYGTGYHLEPPK